MQPDPQAPSPVASSGVECPKTSAATEARIRRTFRPGFVLDDNVVGEAVERPGGRRFIFIHPDRMAQVVKAHRERPLALAAFLHGVAVHELTQFDGKMGDGHDDACRS